MKVYDNISLKWYLHPTLFSVIVPRFTSIYLQNHVVTHTHSQKLHILHNFSFFFWNAWMNDLLTQVSQITINFKVCLSVVAPCQWNAKLKDYNVFVFDHIIGTYPNKKKMHENILK